MKKLINKVNLCSLLSSVCFVKVVCCRCCLLTVQLCSNHPVHVMYSTPCDVFNSWSQLSSRLSSRCLCLAVCTVMPSCGNLQCWFQASATYNVQFYSIFTCWSQFTIMLCLSMFLLNSILPCNCCLCSCSLVPYRKICLLYRNWVLRDS